MFIRALLTCVLASLLFQTTPSPAGEKRTRLAVPEAPWVLTLPADGLVIKHRGIESDGRRGFFLLSDERGGLSVSAFVGPADKCKSSRECRDMVWKAGNPSWENPQNVVLSELGGVSYFEFLMPTFRGAPVRQQHMYAQFVVEGYWVDLHISKPRYEQREHELFERLVKSVRFEPKGGTTGQTPEETARQVAEAWLPLLDSGRYAESWEPLSAKTKNDLGKTMWEMSMRAFREPRGKLRSRMFREVVYTKSLKGHPGHEGANVHFDSLFEKGLPVTEMVLVIRDDDGEWRVLLYIIPE